MTIRFRKSYNEKLKAQLSPEKIREFKKELQRRDKNHGSKTWSYNPSRKCCELALSSYCVCTYSYVCPVHGDTHIGSHD